jgi:uncharacterized protein (TIGR02597 family)
MIDLKSAALLAGKLLLLASATASASAATATTDPIGYTTQPLQANSDTFLSVPFHRPAAFIGQVSSVSGNVITITGSPGWNANQFVYAAGAQANTYYVFVRSGTKEGNYYTVTANTGNTLTVDLAGDSLSGLAAGDALSVVPYWTLGTLFPAADENVSFTASPNSFSLRTTVLMPDLAGSGINLSTVGSYYFYNGAWRRFGQSASVSRDDEILFPDSYVIVRNAANAGTLTQFGGVVTKRFVTPLVTRTGTKQDNPVALPRPIPVSLQDSGLIASGAFAASTNSLVPTDVLLVFDNSVVGKNKSAAATYFYFNNGWRRFGQPVSQDFGSTPVFGPGYGVVIRKAVSATGNTALWSHAATY